MSSKLLVRNVVVDCRYRTFLQTLYNFCLPKVQHIVSRTLKDPEGAEFMASFDTTTEQGRHGKAHMFSVANNLAFAWATMVQGASTASLRNDHFPYASRHAIG